MPTPIYIPIDPAVAPTNASGFLLDFDMQFQRMVRESSPVEDWHTRFAYMPAGASEELEVRMPIELSTFAFEEFNNVPTFRDTARTYLDISIGKFFEGAKLDTRKLRARRHEEIEAWNQRAADLFDAWNRFLPPKIYDLISAGETSGTHPITGGSNFFATDHKVNKKKESLGVFSNLISNGGALSASPIYFVWSGGQFTRMKPWQIRTGAGPASAMTAGGITHSATPGAPWVIRWVPREDSEAIEANFEVKVGIYAEKGWGLLFPQTLWRFEGTLDYAGLKSVVDAARAMKDLNGYNPASSIRLEAILCEPSQVSTINGLLGREVTDSGARQVDLRIDATLQGAAVIPMSR